MSKEFAEPQLSPEPWSARYYHGQLAIFDPPGENCIGCGRWGYADGRTPHGPGCATKRIGVLSDRLSEARIELVRVEAERDAQEKRAILAEQEWGSWRHMAEKEANAHFASRTHLRNLAAAVRALEAMKDASGNLIVGLNEFIAAKQKLLACLRAAEEEGGSG